MNITVVAPAPATFICSADHEGNYILWHYQAILELDGRENIMITETLSDQNSTVTSNLTLFPTDVSLNGVYSCTVFRRSTGVFSTVEHMLTVYGKKT